MKKNIKKILPAVCSIVIFSMAFIIISLRNSDEVEKKLQLSPQKYMYAEKFGEAEAYNESDLTSNDFVKNIRINKKGGVSEPKIVCNPKYKNILAVSSNDFSSKKNSAGIFVSEDGGLSWKPREIELSSRFKISSYSDTWIDFDSEGNLYFVTVQNDLVNASREGIYFAKSTDNGNSWKTDFDFIDYNSKENIRLDRPKIYIDKSSSDQNSVYVTWIEVKGFNSFVMFSKSDNKGITFSVPKEIVKNNVEYCSILGDTGGNLYLTYLEDDKKIVIIKSTDTGNSWGDEICSLNINPAGTQYKNQFVIKKQNENAIRINSEPNVFSNGKEILITYSAAGINGDFADIYFTKFSFKSGKISSPVKVNSDKTNSDQFLPAITTDGSNQIFIIYQDSRNDINNILTETFISISGDGGMTFRDEKLSTEHFNPLSVSVSQFLGDYNSCVISGNKFIGVWTDGRKNNLDIYAGIFDVKEFIGKKKD